MSQVAFAISESNFNIRSYKKQHIAKKIKTHSNHKPVISKLHTEPSKESSTFYKPLHAKTVADGLNKTLKYNSSFIEPFDDGKRL